MSASGRYRPPGGVTSHNLFSWSDSGDSGNPNGSNSGVNGQERRGGRSSVRTAANQMGSQIIFGEVQEELPPSNAVRRTTSQRKQDELSGSGIFSTGPVTTSSSAYANNNDQNNGNYITERPSVRLHQPAGGVSQITFGGEGEITPVKKILSPMKKMELSTTVETVDDVSSRKQPSQRKKQELNGSISIFSPPPEPAPPRLRVSPALRESEDEWKPKGGPKSVGGTSQIVFGEASEPAPPSRRVSEKKVKDLIGTGEYKEESPPIQMSTSKLRELRGCDIFADEPPQYKDSLGGIRQPPGGESHIALV